MTNNDLYLFILRQLEKMYFSNKIKYTQLGIILGQMSLETFKDSDSADPSVKYEFDQLLLSKYTINDYSESDAKEVITKFLNTYQDCYGYELTDVLKDIETFFA